VVNFFLASFVSAVNPESKEERLETNCLVVKSKYTAATDAQKLTR
jgi:hypothetical protein